MELRKPACNTVLIQQCEQHLTGLLMPSPEPLLLVPHKTKLAMPVSEVAVTCGAYKTAAPCLYCQCADVHRAKTDWRMCANSSTTCLPIPQLSTIPQLFTYRMRADSSTTLPRLFLRHRERGTSSHPCGAGMDHAHRGTANGVRSPCILRHVTPHDVCCPTVFCAST